jgi:hypothetical protein
MAGCPGVANLLSAEAADMAMKAVDRAQDFTSLNKEEL